MSFLIKSSSDDLQILGEEYKAYLAHLDSIKNRLPRSARRFALAKWHYNPNDPKCPHDARVLEIKTQDLAKGKRSKFRVCGIRIEILLLGVSQDRLFRVTYKNVVHHTITLEEAQWGFGDWITDEVDLSESGKVLHEIEFDRALLKVECGDILFEEQLTSTPDIADEK